MCSPTQTVHIQLLALLQEPPECTQPLTMHPLARTETNSPRAQRTSQQEPASMLSSPPCSQAPAPVLCSPVQLVSPAYISAANHEEPVDDTPDSPSTPSSPAVQRVFQFSWESPPAAPIAAWQFPRRDPDESENLPVLRAFTDSHDDTPPVPLRAGSHNGEVGTADWIQIHTDLDGFHADDSDALDAQVLPPVLGSKVSSQLLQSLTVQRGSNLARGGLDSTTGTFS